MAAKYGVISIGVRDAVGVRKSFADYVLFDDATATLSSIAAAIAVLVDKFDDVTDGVVETVSMSLIYPVPGTVKSVAVAGSDVEETGLLSFSTGNPGGHGYGQDIPAIIQDALVGRTVNPENAAIAAWVTLMTGTGGTFTHLDNHLSAGMTALRSGQKTFRKSRKALKRA